MNFKIENFISPRNLAVLQHTGLHKLAGALNGFDELTVKEAVAIIGAKARLRRLEMNKIAAGLQDLAALTNEKIASSPLMELLHHAAIPAAAGAGIALAPKLLSPEPTYAGDALSTGATGAVLGGVAGGLSGLARAAPAGSGLASNLTEALRAARGR